MKTISIVSDDRKCGDCTLCCEGWITNVAHGYEMWPGNKCQFVSCGNGCTIYNDRPKSCEEFSCQWLIDKRVPEWMKPNTCGAILKEWEINGIKFLEIFEAGRKLDSEVLTWAFNALVSKKFENIKYQVSSGWNYFGTKEFFDVIRKKYQK